MSRRDFLAKSGAAVAAGAALVGTASAQAPAAPASDVIRWRMASSFPKSVEVLFGTAEFIARRVGQLTGGKFQISTHAAGEIVPPLQVLDAVSAGTVAWRVRRLKSRLSEARVVRTLRLNSGGTMTFASALWNWFEPPLTDIVIVEVYGCTVIALIACGPASEKTMLSGLSVEDEVGYGKMPTSPQAVPVVEIELIVTPLVTPEIARP